MLFSLTVCIFEGNKSELQHEFPGGAGGKEPARQCRRRRQWPPTPVLLPGKPHGRRSPAGCSPWRPWESDPTEQLSSSSSSQCRRHERHGFDPWVGNIPWRRAWQPTPVFWPGKFHRQRSLNVRQTSTAVAPPSLPKKCQLQFNLNLICSS